MNNPFLPDFSININELPSRRAMVQRIANRLLAEMPVAIWGEPRLAKTSLLEYLAAPENRLMLYGQQSDNLIFSLVNGQMLPAKFGIPQFWELALEPIVGDIKNDPARHIAKSYQVCRNHKFSAVTLQHLLKQLSEAQMRLVLMMDEFDFIVAHPALNSAEFFGGLRGLSWRSGLTIVVSSRQSLHQLETKIQNPLGSPYFNIFTAERLHVLSPRDVAIVCDSAGSLFSTSDRQYILNVSGGHPYLLKLACSAMWEQNTSNEKEPYKRYLAVGHSLYPATQHYFNDLWRGWTQAMRQTIIAIVLIHTPHIMKRHEFQINKLIEHLPDFAPEIYELEVNGLIIKDENIPGGYRVAQGAMLWWLADELIRTIRDESSLKEWLLDRRLVGGVLTRKELEYLGQAAKYVGQLLDKGAMTLIEAYAKGMVSAP